SMTPPLLVTGMPREIATGAKGTIHFKLDTASLAGRFQGAILVFLNDPALSEASLTIEGQVVPTIELSPMPAFFVSAGRGESTKSSSIEFINHESDPLRIEKLDYSTVSFTTALENVAAGEPCELTLILK